MPPDFVYNLIIEILYTDFCIIIELLRKCFYLLCLLSQLYTMGSRSVFNISHPMQECEHMGYLSKLIDSAIITNEMRKNASVFHNDVFHILFVSRQNDVLVKYLVQLSNRNATKNLLSATENRPIDKRSIISNAMSRWNESRSAVRGSQNDDGNEDGNESVNR